VSYYIKNCVGVYVIVLAQNCLVVSLPVYLSYRWDKGMWTGQSVSLWHIQQWEVRTDRNTLHH